MGYGWRQRRAHGVTAGTSHHIRMTAIAGCCCCLRSKNTDKIIKSFFVRFICVDCFFARILSIRIRHHRGERGLQTAEMGARKPIFFFGETNANDWWCELRKLKILRTHEMLTNWGYFEFFGDSVACRRYVCERSCSQGHIKWQLLLPQFLSVE